MPYYTQEEIERAREMDLFTYLQRYDPGELVHVHGKEYCTRTHDSLKISNGKWMWWSRGFGGTSALDYLIYVEGCPFTEAVGKILTDEHIRGPDSIQSAQRSPPRRILLPGKSPTNHEVLKYLMARCIDKEILESCIADGLLYESLPYHNCIFVGFDGQSEAKYASYRATSPEKIMGDAAGSNKRYSFRLEGRRDRLHIFESAIDVLSYATMLKLSGGDWRADTMLSLGGVYAPATPNKDMKVPAAITERLEKGGIKEIIFHLDNDFAGREATRRLAEKLQGEYKIRDEPPLYGKDCNDELRQYARQFERVRRERNRDEAR